MGDAATVAAAATAATVAAAATATLARGAASSSLVWGSEPAVGLGPRFTGIGVLLPTAFLGLEALAAPGLEVEVLGVDSLEVGVLGLGSAVLLTARGFLGVVSDLVVEAVLGVSGLVLLAVEGRLRGEGAAFLAAGVEGLVTSFLMGVVVLEACEMGVRPAEGVVVEAGLGVELFAEGVVVLGVGVVVVLGVVVVVLGVAGLVVGVELLTVAGRGAEAGRGAVVPVLGLVVLETGGLSGLGAVAVLGLVVAAGFFTAGVVLTPLVGGAGVFLLAVVPVAFTPLVVVGAEVGRLAVLGAGLFFSGAVEAMFFLATPLVGGFETPLATRLWAVGGRVLVVVGAPDFVLLGVLVFASAEFLVLPVLEAELSLVGSGWGSPCPASTCWPISSSTWGTGSAP